jgi:hypothetical protein
MRTYLQRLPGRRVRSPRSPRRRITAVLASIALALTGLLAISASPKTAKEKCGTTDIALNHPATASSLKSILTA